jgi:hypothetical protein
MVLKRISREGREDAKNREGDQPRAKRFQKCPGKHDSSIAKWPCGQTQYLRTPSLLRDLRVKSFSKAFETE